MAIFASSGSTFAVALAAPATYNSAGYAALTWVLVHAVRDIGSFGPAWEVVEFQSLADGRYYAKGARNDGQIDMTFAYDTADAGQTVLRGAADVTGTSGTVSYRIVTPAGETQYGRGPVLGFQRQVGGANDAMVVTASIRGDSATSVTVTV